MNQAAGSAAAKLAAWQRAQSELVALEQDLSDAMVLYSESRGEPPRQLIIQAERKREETVRLFEVAMEALDAQSLARTGLTNFGSLG
ncbi:hypothetical protein ACFPOE_04855 [Caenimonas terrae]|uniref:Uncharacterized protein n=1 Tax=Caenimonas terrae TaxID=696074 RepID=A0ABW0NA16_9BURK